MTSPRPVLAALAALAAALPCAAHAVRAQEMQEADLATSRGGVVHDAPYFEERVLPLLLRDCSGCHDHDDPNNQSQHRLLVPPPGERPDAETAQADYAAVTKLLDRDAPERSRVLLKLAPLAQGGVDHDGGKADGSSFDTSLLDPAGPLVQWIFGATAARAAPVAVLAPWPADVARGAEVALDASLSFRPGGGDVALEWEIAEAPLGATARLSATSGPKTSLVPDRDGPWVVRCRPRAGGLSGWPVLVRFAATRPSTVRDDGDAPAPTAAVDDATRRLTRALCFDVLGRSPTSEELARLAALPLGRRVDRLLDSIECWEHWCDEEAFYFLLIDRFRPVSDRLASLPARLHDGTADFRGAHTEFALSAEFNARNPGNDTYVTVVLEQFLGLEVQREPRLLGAAKKMYDGQQARIFGTLGGNQSDVVRICLAQPGYVDVFCRRMEQRYLGAPLPDDEHAAAVARIALDPTELRPLLRSWLTSPRYAAEGRAARAKDDHQFIRGLFVDLLGRPPSLQEFRNMRNALQALADPAPLRGVLAKVMLDSGAALPPRGAARARGGPGRERGSTSDGDGAGATSPVSAEEVTDLFQRLLGRDPTAAELATFLEVLAEPGATWRTAAFALLTSPHYQYY